MNPQRMEARDIGFVKCSPARLNHYELCFNKRAHNKSGIAYANVGWHQGAHVEGVYYELDSHLELKKLDVHEGTPYRYSREIFPLIVEDRVQWAWIYVANPAWVTEGLSVEENYRRHLLSGSRFLSKSYLAKLQAMSVVPSTAPLDLRINA